MHLIKHCTFWHKPASYRDSGQVDRIEGVRKWALALW
jgi:hypothetical protein